MRHWLWLERAQRDRLVERIARHDGVMVKGAQGKGLPLRVRAQVGFEAERVDDGYKGREHVQRRARARPFGSDMAASPAEYSVNGRDAIDGRHDLNRVHWLHEAWRGHQEGGVGDAPRSGDDLAAAALDGLGRDRRVEHLKLDVAHRFVAQRPLPRGPAEALQNVLADRAEQLLVHLRGQRVVHKHIGPARVRREAPHGARSEQIPAVFGLEELAQPLAIPADIDGAALDVFGETLFERLGDHRELGAPVRALGEALERGRLEHRLAKGDHWVRDLDLDLGVHVAQVVHHTVEVQLARANDHVLATLLHLGRQQRVRLVELAQPFEHPRQLGRVERLSGELHHRHRVEGERPEDAHVLSTEGGDGTRLYERTLDPLDERPAACWHLRHLDAVARHVNP